MAQDPNLTKKESPQEKPNMEKPKKNRKSIFKQLLIIVALLLLVLYFDSQEDFQAQPSVSERVTRQERLAQRQAQSAREQAEEVNPRNENNGFAGGIFDYTLEDLRQDIRDLLGLETPRRGDSFFSRQEVVGEESAVVDVVEQVSPGVVSIVVRTVNFDVFSGPFEEEAGIGTGFVVDPTGLIVTNSHVVNSPDGEYTVVTNDGETYDVTDIHLDEATDLAIIEVVAQDLPTVELGDSDALEVGQTAIAIGNALGRFSNTVTVGVVSGVARELIASGGFGDLKTYEGAIQTDAALNPGNSGGPLLNIAGQVVGINVATTRGADNIGFAIPVNTLKPILEGFLREGKIVRPYIGVAYTMISKEIAELRGFPEGAFVNRVFTDTPASDAGLERGDIIIEFDGVPVDSDNSLGALIRTKNIGDTVSVVVDRDGEILDFDLVLEEAPETF